MEILINSARNCSFENQHENKSLCQVELTEDRIKNIPDCGYNCTNTTLMAEKVDEFQKSMEVVFEVVLLTVVGILGVIGNITAIVLFARYIIS